MKQPKQPEQPSLFDLPEQPPPPAVPVPAPREAERPTWQDSLQGYVGYDKR